MRKLSSYATNLIKNSQLLNLHQFFWMQIELLTTQFDAIRGVSTQQTKISTYNISQVLPRRMFWRKNQSHFYIWKSSQSLAFKIEKKLYSSLQCRLTAQIIDKSSAINRCMFYRTRKKKCNGQWHSPVFSNFIKKIIISCLGRTFPV